MYIQTVITEHSFLVPFSPAGDEQLGRGGKAADVTRHSASARAVSCVPKPPDFRRMSPSYPLVVCL